MTAILASTPGHVIIMPPTIGGMSPHTADALRLEYDREMVGRVRRGFHVQTFDEWIWDVIYRLRGQTGDDPGAVADWEGR